MENKQQEDIPKWMNFICPSCGIAYGINALSKMIKKRKTRHNIAVDSSTKYDVEHQKSTIFFHTMPINYNLSQSRRN